jgi:acyl-CoA synthetase (AMP-forming)/AMP-acid ligase II
MLPGGLATCFRPDPILRAVEAYSGSITDLDLSIAVPGGELRRARDALSAQLHARGLNSGDRLVVALGNGPVFPAALAAILERGGAPLLVHFQTPPSELMRTALRVGARGVLADGCEASDLQALTHRVLEITAVPWARLTWADIDPASPSFDGTIPPLPAVPLHPTSGTTGVPKLAVRPAERAMAEAVHYSTTMAIDERDVLLAVAPMSHAYAFGMCVMVPLVSGAQVLSMRRFRPKTVQSVLAERRVTIFPAVPVMLDNLLFGAGDKLHNPRCRVLSAGAPLPERTARAFAAKSGAAIRPLYGTTETGGISVATAEEGAAYLGSVGRPMDGVMVKVCPADGVSQPGAGVGRLLVRSGSMMAGYLSPHGIDGSPLRDDWFETGDLARMDEAGRIYLLGRETDVINVYGMKVVPSEVEEVVAALPGVSEVKVYAGKRRSGTQFVKAAIVASAPLDVKTVRDHCERHLVYYKCPDTVLLVDSLPKTASGKIIRDQLP